MITRSESGSAENAGSAPLDRAVAADRDPMWNALYVLVVKLLLLSGLVQFFSRRKRRR